MLHLFATEVRFVVHLVGPFGMRPMKDVGGTGPSQADIEGDDDDQSE
jgi:hypothetical protein